MRNLTLGLMIVAGGTIAALPFRRTQTGDNPLREETAADSYPVEVPAFPVPVGMSVDPREPQAEWIEKLALPDRDQTARFPVQRELSSALSYDDLAVPITRPQTIEKRFSATVKSSAPKVDRENKLVDALAGNEPPAGNWEAPTSKDTPPTEEHTPMTVPSKTTSLASTPIGEPEFRQLPKQNASSRERFWIRQP